MIKSFISGLLLAASVLFLTSCGDSSDGSNGDAPNGPTGGARLTLQLTDAPGDLAHAWVEISGITLLGEDDNDQPTTVTVFSGSTGMIDLHTLADATVDLVTGQAVPVGSYNRMRVDIKSAVIETFAGQVIALAGSQHPEGKAVNLEMDCFSCTSTNPNVKLPVRELELDNQAKTLLLDFDVNQSFGRLADGSGAWYMRPAIFAVDMDNHGSISGRVVLENGVTLPPCGGQTTTLESFTIHTFDAADAVRSGKVAADGTYRLDYMVPGRYGMRYDAAVDFDTQTLFFNAVNPVRPQVVVEAGATATMDYTLNVAECRDRL